MSGVHICYLLTLAMQLACSWWVRRSPWAGPHSGGRSL